MPEPVLQIPADATCAKCGKPFKLTNEKIVRVWKEGETSQWFHVACCQKLN